jgi:TRAP-type C4-dicarboxylate transport system substrate-binding protein
VASSVAEQRRLWQEASEHALAQVRGAGVEIIVPDPSAFRDAALPMLESYVGTPIGDLLLAIEGVR